MTTPLDLLKPEILSESVPILPPPAILRRALHRLASVRTVHWAVRRGTVSESMVREFVASMMSEFRRGEQLPADITLGALAASLEACRQEFAEEYLCDLARLRLAEMPMSIRVAQECLQARYERPINDVRWFQYSAIADSRPTRPIVVRPIPSPSVRPNRVSNHKYTLASGAK